MQPKTVGSLTGFLPLDERTLPLLTTGGLVHFNPETAHNLGLRDGSSNITLRVESCLPREKSVVFALYGWTAKTLFVAVDVLGSLCEFDGKAVGVARDCVAFWLPIFRKDGYVICPFCGKNSVYSNGADICPGRRDPVHSPLPTVDSRGFIPCPIFLNPTWLIHGEVPRGH